MKGRARHALFTKASGYMKLLYIPLGLVIKFHALELAEGISRLILPETNLFTGSTRNPRGGRQHARTLCASCDVIL